MPPPFDVIAIAGVRIELARRGKGAPLLLLHPGDDIHPGMPIVDRLAERFEVVLPVHPGFGTSELPASFSTVDDLSYFYLDLLEQLDLRGVTVLGISFGAWIAAAIAIKSTERIAALALASPVGAKFKAPDEREIRDLFTLTAPQAQQFLFADPARDAPRYTEMTEDDLLRVARGREAMQLFGWSPTLHDPKLRQRLRRIGVPTKILWGEKDRVIAAPYARAFADAIPGAEFRIVAGAGHYMHVDRPEVLADEASGILEPANRKRKAV